MELTRPLRALRPRRPASRGSWAMTVVAVLLVLVALVGLAAHVRAPGRAWVIGFSAFAPYLMLAAPVAAILFVLARQWVPLVVAIVVVAVCVSTQSRLYVAEAAPAGAHPVVVMTSNLRLGLADPDALVREVRDHHVDVLMLEELTPEEQTRLVAAGLDKLLPHHNSEPRPSAQGTGLWSRYPLTDVEHPAGFNFALVTARIAIPGLATAPTFVALHMTGPVPDSTDWQRDIARLPSLLRGLPTTAPVVVGGDFNATPDVAQFRHVLAAGYRDGAEQAGAGMTRTYPSDTWYPPLIAIDHVLTRDAVATSADTLEIPGSDHRALLVTVALPKTA